MMEAKNLMPMDELNRLLTDLSQTSHKKSNKEIEDAILDILVLAYIKGNEYANQVLGSKVDVDPFGLRMALDQRFNGKTWTQSLNEYLDKGDANGVRVVAESNMHRLYNNAIQEVADNNRESSGVAVYKTWHSQEDDRVRDTHTYLDLTTVRIEDDFYSYTGSHGPYPGMFNDPAEDVNCRCFITVSKG